MKGTLQEGLTFEFSFQIPENKTVPHLYPESEEFQAMPRVLATGFMVGLIEWACLNFLNNFIDWPREQSLGTDVRLNHTAATPPGLTVTVKGKIAQVEGQRVKFEVSAHDGIDQISEGTHERFIIDVNRFNARMERKSQQVENLK